jgi:hypothetical protein
MARGSYARWRGGVSDWVDSAGLPGVEKKIMSGRTGRRPFPANGSPASVGVHERSL